MSHTLSTEHVAKGERFDLWRELICGVFVQLDCEPLGTGSFSGRIATDRLGPIGVSEVVTTPQRVVRSRAQISRAREDDVLVSIQLSERGVITQDGRSAVIRDGDFALYDSTRPYELLMDRPFRQLVWQLPREMLAQRAPRAVGRTAVSVDASAGMGAVVSHYLVALAGRIAELSGPERLTLAPTVADLLAASLGPSDRDVEPSSLSRLHLERARAHIRANAGTPSLSPGEVAGAIGVSERYLFRLFELEGSTPARFLMAVRLDRCAGALAARATAHQPITAVAFANGFSSSAQFSRAFRRRFGTSPRDYRHAALASGEDHV